MLCLLLLIGAVSLRAQAPIERVPPPPSPASAPATPVVPPADAADDVAPNRDIFQKPVDPSQLLFLKQYAGKTTADLLKDKAAKKLLWSFIPSCEFHYGRDMPLKDAFEMVTDHAKDPVLLVEDRYLVISGEMGPYLSGKGGMWVDLQKGIALGVFYFTPTNGEPTPSVVVFGNQVQEPSLRFSQMPPVFTEFLNQWAQRRLLPAITPRYFIGGNKKRILLEHDEDYCAPYGGAPNAHPACDQAAADAADVDVNSAYYLDKIHYATNGTAWMLGPDQVAWLQFRDTSCRGIADPLGCRIRVTRERTHVILHLPARYPRSLRN